MLHIRYIYVCSGTGCSSVAVAAAVAVAVAAAVLGVLVHSFQCPLFHRPGLGLLGAPSLRSVIEWLIDHAQLEGSEQVGVIVRVRGIFYIRTVAWKQQSNARLTA